MTISQVMAEAEEEELQNGIEDDSGDLDPGSDSEEKDEGLAEMQTHSAAVLEKMKQIQVSPQEQAEIVSKAQ